jgi:peroxiredoxin/uncharacterized GH25 family protein
VYIAKSLNGLRGAVRTDKLGKFILENGGAKHREWIAYCRASQALGLFAVPDDYSGQAIQVVLSFKYATVEGRLVGSNGEGLADREVELIVTTQKGEIYRSQCYDKTDKHGYYEGGVPCAAGLSVRARLADADETEQKHATEVVPLKDNQVFVRMPTLVIGDRQPEKISGDGRFLYSGRVLNDEGEPIVGATVKLTFDLPGHMVTQTNRVTTDKQGRWDRRIPAKHSGIDIELLHPDYISYHFDSSGRRPTKSELIDGTNITVMKRGVGIRGRIVDQNGDPVANALVTAGKRYLHFGDGVILEDCTTDRTLNNGSFKIGGLPQEDINIAISAVDYAPKIVPVEVRKDMDPVQVVLRGGQTYTGRIVDTEGNPIEGVKIEGDGWQVGTSHRSLGRITRTDSQGFFKIDRLPDEGKIKFEFSKRRSDYLEFSNYLPEDLSSVDRIVMHEAPVFNGKVVDAGTAEPIDNFQVTLGFKETGYSESIDWRRDRREQVNSEDGTFSTAWPGYNIDYPFNGSFHLWIEAKGYFSEVTPPVELGKEYQPFIVRLTKGEPWRGIVVDRIGKPAAGAEVGWVGPKQRVFIKNGKFYDWDTAHQVETVAKTDLQGQFELGPFREEGLIVVLHENGYSHIKSSVFDNGSHIQLAPWAKIEGTFVRTDKQGHEYSIRIEPIISYEDKQSNKIEWDFDEPSFSENRFAVRCVPCVPLYIGPLLRWELSNPVYVKPQPGETCRIQIGAENKSAQGRIVLPSGGDKQLLKTNMLQPRQVHAVAYLIEPEPQVPSEVRDASPNFIQWLWRDSKSVYESSKTFQKRFIPTIKDNGEFRLDDLLPGRYEFIVNIHAPAGENAFCGRNALKAVGTTQFSVESSGTTEPIRVPDVKVKLIAYPEVFELAPLFEVESTDGGTVKLEALLGKVVLLDFWATWCPPCVKQIPKMKELYDTFGSDERFVMIGLSVDSDAGKARDFIKQNRLGWLQVLLGNMGESAVIREYGIGGIPAIILIGPEGRVLAKNPDAKQLIIAIRQAINSI